MNSTKTFDTSTTSEEAVYTRRRFLRNAAMVAGAAQLGITGLAKAQSGAGPATALGGSAESIRPFRVDIPDADLAELKRRILATRWPERENVPDATQGVQRAHLSFLQG